jgi:branched-subunit amino acid aminotransferase/4-amino-4-deoxychorismate lyase
MSSTKELNAVADELVPDLISKYTFTESETPFQIFTTIRYDPNTYINTKPIIDAINEMPLDASFFYLLKQHVEKLRRSGRFFGFPTDNLTLTKLLHHLTIALQSTDRLIAHRVKVSVSKTGEYSIEFAALPKSHTLNTKVPKYEEFQSNNNNNNNNINNNALEFNNIPKYLCDWKDWNLYLDTEQTLPTPFTSFKTSNRKAYNDSRNRFNIIPGDHREVLLHDMNGNVLEGSITSVAFWRQIKDPLTNEITFKWITPQLGIGCMDGVVRKHLINNGEIFQGVIPVKELQDGEYVLLMNALMGIKPAKLILQN